MPAESAAIKSRWRPNTTERGYGAGHQAARARVEPFVLAGGARCARCGEQIVPGEPWHLDHRDDGRGYLGPSHSRCNLHVGGVEGARRRWQALPAPEPVPELVGVGQDDVRWRVP